MRVREAHRTDGGDGIRMQKHGVWPMRDGKAHQADSDNRDEDALYHLSQGPMCS
jgi:hypothetical protein